MYIRFESFLVAVYFQVFSYNNLSNKQSVKTQ